jgi:putative glutamine amidotransferase
MKRPIIGITLDHEIKDSYSKYPWYALRENYANAVFKHGGIPLMIPHQVGAEHHYISLIDGLIITGGDFDIDPSYYGENIISDRVTTKDTRTQFEIEICRQALKSLKPLLGICAGEQLINVVLGGSLIQHIPDSIVNPLEHEQKNPRHETSHEVRVVKETLLRRIIDADSLQVNSSHHQAVKSLGSKVIASAYAPDTVIEAIELTDHPFCLGVQWHPEFLITPEDNNICSSFIKACT